MLHRFRSCFWISTAITLLLEGVAIRYLSLYDELTLVQWVHFIMLSIGHFFILNSVIALLLLIPLSYLVKGKAFWLGALVINSAWVTLVLADTFVFQLYRFHLNWAVMDLFINGGSEVIHFSLGMWIQILVMLMAVMAAVAGLLFLVYRYLKNLKVWPWATSLMVAFIIGNLSHAYAVAFNDSHIASLSEAVPWSRPITMTSFLKKVGLATEEVGQVKVQSASLISYPLKPLQFNENTQKPFNIVFVLSDSLRADMLNSVNMPHTWKIAEDNIRFENHYSSGNATRAGIFGLFYGLPPSYWHSVLKGQIPSAFITALQTKGYQIEAFTSARLTSPEFNKTVFASVGGIRLGSEGQSSWERDLDSVSDFSEWVKQIRQPFFSFIFLDNIHAYETDPKQKPTFKPAWTSVNNLKLNNDLDPTEYFNLYKNAVWDTDRNIEKIWAILKKENLLDNTIVIISSDHGEEFNDNHQNYWGHNGNFTDAQIKIPLVIHWPGKKTQVYSHMTTAYDLTATLMPEVLGCTNPTQDYSVGTRLWEPKQKNWFIVGSYQNSAIVEQDRIVLINGAGFLSFKDRQYRETSHETRTPNLLEAIELMSRYRQK